MLRSAPAKLNMSLVLARQSTPDNLRCPRCDYDVRQTLADRKPLCPECGAQINWTSAAVDLRRDAAARRWGWFLLPFPGTSAAAFVALAPYALARWWILAMIIAVLAGSIRQEQQRAEPRPIAEGLKLGVVLVLVNTGLAMLLLIALATLARL